MSKPADTRGKGDNAVKAAGIAADRLEAIVKRIESVEEEMRGLRGDRSELYAEAKGAGFDTRIVRQVVKLRQREKDDIQEEAHLLELYCRALGMDFML